MPHADSPSARLATRLAFLAAGFGIACWAPLVPFAQQRLAVDAGMLGMLLLCLGIGSVAAMMAVGTLSAQYGPRLIILASGLGLAGFLPLLAVAGTPALLGTALLLFGACLGSLDVAMNIHAVEVERAGSRPLMSGFHALFSIGGFAGSAMMTLLLSLGTGPLRSAMLGSVLIVVSITLATPRLLRFKAAEGEPHISMPRGIVLVLATLAAITFLAEGALLDWSALLITGKGLVSVQQGGLGYMLFAIAMTAGRLTGDAMTARIGDRAAVRWGGMVAVGGFLMLLLAPIAAVALAGFILIGLGAANIVPVLFRQAGAQTVMPANLAIAALATTGYAGVLVGPAAIGFVAKGIGLTASFWMLAGLLCLVPLSAAIATPQQT
ncbi:MFS transporter [Novosphingobium rosa]|uniref:MFS transporter n=1 Tax=Novosphingobium rosa TaxID=76978 RepID=UPI00082ED8E2|nr:MFS transporter [Novosphingobium rosa]